MELVEQMSEMLAMLTNMRVEQAVINSKIDSLTNLYSQSLSKVLEKMVEMAMVNSGRSEAVVAARRIEDVLPGIPEEESTEEEDEDVDFLTSRH